MRYICQVCGYVYDETAEDRLFSSLPEDWKCPLCRAGKDQFRPEETAEPADSESEPSVPELSPDEMSPGRLSVICSDLARGCEKQYKAEEAALFRELAEFFRNEMPEPEKTGLEELARQIRDDADHYRNVRKTADEAEDRGAARICVWGEKVTRMLASLTDRYLREGEQMLAGTDIWVCSVCGFVYIGDEAPGLCPVCKVPAWKFDRVKGRKQA